MNTSSLGLPVRAGNGCTVVELLGDASAPAAVRDALAATLHGTSTRLVVDLSHVNHMVRAAIDVLLSAQEDLMARGATMAVACPRPTVAKMLDTTGADERIPVYDKLSEAVRGHVAVC